VHPTAKPPPGFCQAAPEFDATVLLSQNHCPAGVKSCLACTDTQYVPAGKLTGEVNVIVNTPAAFVNGEPGRLATKAPGSVAVSE